MTTARRVRLLLGVAALTAVNGCSDAVDPIARIPQSQQSLSGNTITVASAAELIAALSPENAGRRILVRAGTYDIDHPLIVPDGVTLEGEGVMQFDGAGLPTGFAAGARTTLSMTANVPGDMLTLGDGVTIRRLELVDLVGRTGNVIAVASRAPGDRVTASILESVMNPALGYGLDVRTRNLNLGADPPPDEGATISARMAHSLIRSSTGVGGVFAFNFAPLGKVAVTLTGNVVITPAANALNANGGVSLPDAVHDSETRIQSRGNRYRREASDLCAPSPAGSAVSGWNLAGGSGPPAPVTVSETARNTLRVHSQGDRIEGFKTGVLARGSARFFGPPLAGPSTDNHLELELIGATVSTPSCGADPAVRDLNLVGAFVTSNTFAPGNGNTLRAVIRQVTGSGPRFNQYANEGGPFGSLQGLGNRLEIVGNAQAFARTNRRIDPAPSPEFFVSQTH